MSHPDPLRQDVALDALNTLRLPARAAWFAAIDNVDTLRAVLDDPRVAGLPRLVLGGGSNLVLTGDFPGLVLQVAFHGRSRVQEDADAFYIRAGGGENWHDFVRWTLEMGWPGLENLSLIPGTVGAAPVQNIGAYGIEMAEHFYSLRAYDLETGKTVGFDKRDCAFGYRDSFFKQAGKGRYLIAAVTFRLPKAWKPVTGYADVARELTEHCIVAPTPLQVSDAVVAIRRRKLPDPAEIGNAGSFFKNPVVEADHYIRLAALHRGLPHYPQPDGREKLAAGWLIEQAGWRGRRRGPVGCYERQALVLVNHGGATGADVWATSNAVRADVLDRFGINLEPEPVFVGPMPAAFPP
ncbi:MAG TPA: UDP-N-acetylmuramate dehydrogenase [Zoogloea sp.]|jgi:UDP-N-acetylmuramate dehydrogenase|uniref:UDP-N-acetylmuramate dehydrogenase n=1 Tax=Zoogloea sp. TaxID=49181 RepID=UPI002B62F639|nr:UDP-N-acetylmuramate dehydrogenase [Zoogloea sp.]HOB45734.1 UDP-N-acetylmuramate dehydrogenase [Zoogloea sp.]HQA10702.1 UDP-N-acetylmuramate dehydrogenase [Zoogloea sp.]